MALLIKPAWDPSDTVSLKVCADRREVVVTAEGEITVFRLRQERSDRLGWVEHQLADGAGRRRRVSVAEVVCGCLREPQAEELVIEISRRAAKRATRRRGAWRTAGERLARQIQSARGGNSRLSALPFRVLWRYRSDPHREQPLTASMAAERIGWAAGGRADTTRLLRRFGVAEQQDGRRRRAIKQRSVNYRTGLQLCRAIDVDPVELGL